MSEPAESKPRCKAVIIAWQPREEEMGFIIERIKQILPKEPIGCVGELRFNSPSTDNRKEDLQ